MPPSDITKILYVDDEDANRVVFAIALEDEFDVSVAKNGQEALDYLEQHEVAIVVSDQRMPGMSGNELLQQIKKRWPTSIRMIITGYADVNAILQSMNEGLVARYVVKPWDEDELRRMLRWGLQAYAMANAEGGDVLQARLLESERLATLGAIQASFLHELGTPLSYISGAASELELLGTFAPELIELIKNDTTRDPKQWLQLTYFLTDASEILANLQTGARLLVHLRDEVRHLTSPAARDAHSVCDGEAVQRAIHFCIAVNKADAILAKTTLRYEEEGTPPDLALSPEDLMQVLINLTRNAVQAHSSDGQSSQGQQREVVIKIQKQVESGTNTDDGGFALLSITDNGEGMSTKLAGTIGKQFYSTRDTGTGLGVFKCRTIIGAVGGSLTYESKLGEGTTAIARLPLAPASQPI